MVKEIFKTIIIALACPLILPLVVEKREKGESEDKE